MVDEMADLRLDLGIAAVRLGGQLQGALSCHHF